MRDAFYMLNVDLTRSARKMVRSLKAGQVEEILTAYMALLGHPKKEDQTTIEIDIDVVQQMAMLAGVTLSRFVMEGYKSEE